MSVINIMSRTLRLGRCAWVTGNRRAIGTQFWKLQGVAIAHHGRTTKAFRHHVGVLHIGTKGLTGFTALNSAGIASMRVGLGAFDGLLRRTEEDFYSQATP